MSEVKTTALAAFAEQLRKWRKHSGRSQAELGSVIGYSPSLISGIENMDKTPVAEFARALDETFGIPDVFVTLQRLVAREAYPAFFAPAVGFEHDAIRIHGWELGVIPGLLQTEEYARALITDTQVTDHDRIDQLVAARVERQAVLTGKRRPMVWYVLDEGSLRRGIGGSGIMTGQLDRLLEVAGSPSIVVQVLPFTADNHAGSDGPITVYEFDRMPPVGYTECFAGGRLVENRDEVARLMTVISFVRAAALSPLQSLEVIRQIRSDLR